VLSIGKGKENEVVALEKENEAVVEVGAVSDVPS